MKDSNLKKSSLCSLIFTFIFCSLLTCVFALIKTEDKTEYKTVQISLAPENTVKTEGKLSPEKKVISPQKKAETAKSEKKVLPPSSENSSSSSSSEKYKKIEKQVLGKTIEEQIAENKNIQRKTKNVDDVDWDSMFSENEGTSSSVKKDSKKSDFQSSFSGTAASASSSSSASISSSSEKQASSTSTVTSSVNSSLDSISKVSNTLPVSSSSSSGYSTVKNTSGKINVSISGGKTRALLKPLEPAINLSEEAASQIDSSRTVKVIFKIQSGGTVRLNDISFVPSSSLPEKVQSEIMKEISLWIFAADSEVSEASFIYTISVRH